MASGAAGQKGGGVITRATNSGYTVQAAGKPARQAALQETVLKALGLGMLPAAVFMLVLGGDIRGTGVILADIGLPMAFAILGLALFAHANRGFCRQIQVNPSDRSVSLGVVNSAGRFHSRQKFQARDIHSAFLARSKTPGRPSQLFLRRRGAGRPVLLLEGAEDSLEPVLERLVASLKSTAKAKKPAARRPRVSLPHWVATRIRSRAV